MQQLSNEMAGWYPVPEDQLPVILPRIEDYKPGDDGVAPLAKHKEFYETTCPGCGGKAVRETDVSDTFLDSSWYFLRYPSIGGAEVESNGAYRGSPFAAHPSSRPSSPSAPPREGVTVLEKTRRAAPNLLPWDPEITKKWLPVSMYTGGAEHSVLHLLYARFVWKALLDWGYLDFSREAGSRFAGEEPFTRFYAHGLVIKDGAKMSKSKGNVVNPDEYIASYGADALRLYLMFMGPFSQGGDFRDSAMEGMSRWIKRVWRLAMASLSNLSTLGDLGEVKKALHRLVKKITEDMEKRRYNTAIASMMEFTNLVEDQAQGRALSIEDLKTFILLLAPFAPHMSEELWARVRSSVLGSRFSDKGLPVGQSTGQQKADKPNSDNRQQKTDTWSVHLQPWPSYDPSAIEEDTVTIIVQVNGKVRETISMPNAKCQMPNEVEREARKSGKVQKFLEGRSVKNVVFVPGKLINFVVA